MISPRFARRGQYVVVFILGHVLSDDRPQTVPGFLLRQPIRLGRNGWPVWVLERVSQQGMAWGVTRTVLPADQVPRGVVQGIYLTQDHFSIAAALLWPPPWSVIMLPLLLLVPN